MKKLLLATAVVLASVASAHAEVNLDIGLGGPAYVQPAPVYYDHQPGYYNGRDRHRHYNYDYWRHDDHHDDHHR